MSRASVTETPRRAVLDFPAETRGEGRYAAVHGRAYEGRGREGEGRRRGSSQGRRDAEQVRREVPEVLVRREERPHLLPRRGAEQGRRDPRAPRGARPRRRRDQRGHREQLDRDELTHDLVPIANAVDEGMRELCVPRAVEEEDRHVLLRETPRDDGIVLAEAVELEPARNSRLVLAGSGRVVGARDEVPDRLQLDRRRVAQQALPFKPLRRDPPAALGASGDEVHLMTGRDEPRQGVGAVRVALQFAEELAVVQLHAELVLLLLGDVGELVEQVPAEHGVAEVEPELLGEGAKVRRRAFRNHVVDVHADPHWLTLWTPCYAAWRKLNTRSYREGGGTRPDETRQPAAMTARCQVRQTPEGLEDKRC